MAAPCSTDGTPLQRRHASLQPRRSFNRSGSTSLQLRRGFIATLAELRRPRGASLQLRGRFIATPMDLRRPPWRFIAAPAVPAILHRNAGESLSASLVAAARRPACSTAPPCGELADVAQLLSSASRLQHVRQVAPSCDTIDGCSTPQDPRRHTMRKICAASGAALRHRPRLHYRLPRRSSRSVDRDGEVMDREGRRSQREQS